METHTTAGFQRRDAWSVFVIFLKLGLTSFGGPAAHLGYFHDEFVKRRKWLSDQAYADLVALCQFLPGPASSQVGMAIGLQRVGILGLALAWVGFTLPSAILLFSFALGVTALGGLSDAGWVAGFKVAAVAVVAHAVLTMAKTLTPDAKRATIAAGVVILVLIFPGPLTIVGALLVSGLMGVIWLRTDNPADDREAPRVLPSRGLAIVCLAAFAVLLIGLPILATVTGNEALQQFNIFYHAGALVFGGGHVVLPLLEADLVQSGLVDPGVFLAGYGAAQAVPGPIFTFSAYLGAVMTIGPGGVPGATVALLAIFLPSVFLVIGVMPFWDRLRRAHGVRRALMGINAGVVGLLAATLYNPVFTAGVTGPVALSLAVAGFVALAAWRAPAWAVVLGAGLVGQLLL